MASDKYETIYEQAKSNFIAVKRIFIEKGLVNSPEWRNLWVIPWKYFIGKNPQQIFDLIKEGDLLMAVEKVTIEFTKEEFDKIVEFMDGGEYETIQEAIMAAIENAE